MLSDPNNRYPKKHCWQTGGPVLHLSSPPANCLWTSADHKQVVFIHLNLHLPHPAPAKSHKPGRNRQKCQPQKDHIRQLFRVPCHSTLTLASNNFKQYQTTERKTVWRYPHPVAYALSPSQRPRSHPINRHRRGGPCDARAAMLALLPTRRVTNGCNNEITTTTWIEYQSEVDRPSDIEKKIYIQWLLPWDLSCPHNNWEWYQKYALCSCSGAWAALYGQTRMNIPKLSQDSTGFKWGLQQYHSFKVYLHDYSKQTPSLSWWSSHLSSRHAQRA